MSAFHLQGVEGEGEGALAPEVRLAPSRNQQDLVTLRSRAEPLSVEDVGDLEVLHHGHDLLVINKVIELRAR